MKTSYQKTMNALSFWAFCQKGVTKFHVPLSLLCGGLLCVMFSCQTEKTDIRPLEIRLASDPTFNSLVEKTIQLTSTYATHLSSLNLQEKEKTRRRIAVIQQSNQTSSPLLSEAATLVGYKSSTKLLQDMQEINQLKQELAKKFPGLYNSDNQETVETAIKSCESFKSLSSKSSARAAGNNCGGIYGACQTAVAVAGVFVVGACGPAAPFCVYGAVALAAAGMELCRQEYIGCVKDHNL